MNNFLIITIAYLPFQLALNPMTGVDLASIRVLIISLFFIWLAQGLKKKKLQIKNNLQTWLVSSFLFLNLFSLIVAKNVDWSARKLLFLFSIFPIYFIASQVITDMTKTVRIIKTMVLGGAIMAMLGIIQFFAQFISGFKTVFIFWAKSVIPPFLGDTFTEAVLKNPSWLVNIDGKTYLRATALFPDPHMLAFYLGILLPLALWLAIYSDKKKQLFRASFIVIVITDLLTFSRGGYLGLVAGIAVAGFLFRHKIMEKYKLITTGILIIIAIIIFIPSPISQRFFTSFNLKEGSNYGRIIMWEKAVETMREHPALGVGIGNYSLEIAPTATYRNSIYAHNTYLDIAVESGILNMLIWLGVLGASAISFWKKAEKEKLFFFCLLGVIIFSAHSLVETALYSPIALTTFLVLISLSNVELKNENST